MNHEAWAIPYGDLITLLLAFFVVMYALSSVNEGKYRVLSDSLVAAFRSAPKSLEPIQVGEPTRAQGAVEIAQRRTLVPLEVDQQLQELQQSREWQYMRELGMSPEEIDETMAEISELNDLIGDALQEWIAVDQVRLRPNSFWLEIEVDTSLLFPVAGADLSAQAVPIIDSLGEILAETDARIQVEGHTDDVPIATQAFRSNWELSSARAATVVKLFADAGVDPRKMAAVGYGEFQPVADNGTEDGRSANRRVVIIVTSDGETEAGEVFRPSLQLAESDSEA